MLEVHDIRMRKLGPFLVGDMRIVVDGGMSVREADQIAIEIEEQVKKEFDEVTETKVRIEPQKPSTGARALTFNTPLFLSGFFFGPF